MNDDSTMRATTIIAVRRDGTVALAGDGQVTLGNTVMKQGAAKIRRLHKDTILAGFAGSASDAFALFSRLEGKLEAHQGNLKRAAYELGRDWRTDRVLRKLDALMLVADKEITYLLSGGGEVLEPDDGLAGIGSGGAYALAAGRAMLEHTGLPAETIAREAIRIASTICIYTNDSIRVETLPPSRGE
jgi:ATP-dependent HslUV protease subunit HslV